MKVQVLHIDDCPNWEETGARTRQALDELGFADTPVEFTRVETDEAAADLGFVGSPSIMIDGQDLFPAKNRATGLACRVYRTDTGISGLPTYEQLKEALTERARQLGEHAGEAVSKD